MDGNNLLVVCIPYGINPAFTVPPDVYWELKGAVWEGSDPLLTADAKQGMLLRHSTSDLSSLLGKDFKHSGSAHASPTTCSWDQISLISLCLLAALPVSALFLLSLPSKLVFSRGKAEHYSQPEPLPCVPTMVALHQTDPNDPSASRPWRGHQICPFIICSHCDQSPRGQVKQF